MKNDGMTPLTACRDSVIGGAASMNVIDVLVPKISGPVSKIRVLIFAKVLQIVPQFNVNLLIGFSCTLFR